MPFDAAWFDELPCLVTKWLLVEKWCLLWVLFALFLALRAWEWCRKQYRTQWFRPGSHVSKDKDEWCEIKTIISVQIS